MKLFIILLVFVAYLQGKSDAVSIVYSSEGQLLDILVPRNLLDDFEYVPTDSGYRYRYLLIDGTGREEIGFINSNELGDGVFAMGGGRRPATDNKSRKLSPKSLQASAG